MLAVTLRLGEIGGRRPSINPNVQKQRHAEKPSRGLRQSTMNPVVCVPRVPSLAVALTITR